MQNLLCRPEGERFLLLVKILPIYFVIHEDVTKATNDLSIHQYQDYTVKWH